MLVLTPRIHDIMIFGTINGKLLSKNYKMGIPNYWERSRLNNSNWQERGIFHWYIEVDVKRITNVRKTCHNLYTFIPVILPVIFTCIIIWLSATFDLASHEKLAWKISFLSASSSNYCILVSLFEKEANLI